MEVSKAVQRNAASYAKTSYLHIPIQPLSRLPYREVAEADKAKIPDPSHILEGHKARSAHNLEQHCEGWCYSSSCDIASIKPNNTEQKKGQYLERSVLRAMPRYSKPVGSYLCGRWPSFRLDLLVPKKQETTKLHWD